MTDTILSTKLFIPAMRANWVPRPHLIERMNAGLSSSLTLVSAPAGFGKTTLLSSWIGQINQPSAWLSLDENDNDLSHFLRYFIAALQQVKSANIHSQIGVNALRVLKATQPPMHDAVLIELINEVAALPETLVLCIDDYHLIENPQVHQALTYYLEHAPVNLHLAIGTRSDPPLPISRMRSRGQVNELRGHDLQFSENEACAFFEKTMGRTLPKDTIKILNDQTEGWVTGLQLAGLSLSALDAQQATHFIRSFSGRHHLILDYLLDEVIDQQPMRVQEFLFRTAILSRLSGPLCDYLLATEVELADSGERAANHSQALLEELYQANLFLEPLDNEHQWFRYHRLFKELLEARLEDQHPGLSLKLHRQAAEWYGQAGYLSAAVSHALSAEDYPFAANLIQRVVNNPKTLSSVSLTTLIGWLQALPDDEKTEHPWLKLFEARVLTANGDWKSANQLMDSLSSWARAHQEEPETRKVLAHIHTDRASTAAAHGDIQTALTYAKASLPLVDTDDIGMRIRLIGAIGMAYLRAGNIMAAEEEFSQAITIALESNLGFAAVPFSCNLAEAQILAGQLNQAVKTCQEAVEMGTFGGRPNPINGFIEFTLGKIGYLRNELPQAEQRMFAGLNQLASAGIADSFGSIHSELALVYLAAGNTQEAGKYIDRAIRIANHAQNPRLTTLYTAYRTLIWLAEDRLKLALEWADSYRHTHPVEYLREFEDLTLVKVLLAAGKVDKAQQYLVKLEDSARAAGRWGSWIGIQVLLASALLKLGDEDSAASVFNDALNQAKPENIQRPFIDAGPTSDRLLQKIYRTSPQEKYLTTLIAAVSEKRSAVGRGKAQPQTNRVAPELVLLEPLTEREIDVLVLLAEGLSNAEIGQKLFIALPTVKSHTRNIYGKLNVHNRKQAVVQAKSLGILPDDQYTVK